MLLRYLSAAAALLLAASTAAAQTAADHVRLGDEANTAMDAAAALNHYREAIALDSTDYEALWKASREAVDLGEFEPDKAKRTDYYTEAERDARRAVAINPNDAEGHFNLARSLGRVALTLGKKDRVRYAKEIREQAIDALKYDSLHAGALHVMGRWNAEIMRLSGFSRFFAKNFLGGAIFDKASWDSAVYYMAKSVEQDPTRLVHHLDYGEILRDRNKDDDRAKARAQLEMVVNGKATEYNDKYYKKEAEEDLAKMK